MAPPGTSIAAADSGTVIVVAFNRGWGNYVVINHGNGITTLYAHMSAMHVSVGQSVSRGQHIGNVGSTGNATAPHVHFEVRVNGAHVNPRTMLG
jgi:murein DD-endopeptidase MepM/ murein hydrolase activator NlpD